MRFYTKLKIKCNYFLLLMKRIYVQMFKSIDYRKDAILAKKV